MVITYSSRICDVSNPVTFRFSLCNSWKFHTSRSSHSINSCKFDWPKQKLLKKEQFRKKYFAIFLGFRVCFPEIRDLLISSSF